MQSQPTPSAARPDRSGLAIASLILGIVSICLEIPLLCGIPLSGFLLLCTIPFSGVAIILGALSMRSSRRGMAIAGLILGILTLLLSLGNAAFGAYLGLTGNMFNMQGLQ